MVTMEDTKMIHFTHSKINLVIECESFVILKGYEKGQNVAIMKLYIAEVTSPDQNKRDVIGARKYFKMKRVSGRIYAFIAIV
jgi:hypothetical protein